MSRYKDIPQPSDQRNVSQNDILSNYQYLATALGGPPAGVKNGIIKVDHEQFGDNDLNPKDGFHNQVSLLDRGVPANLTNAVNNQTSDSILYSFTDGTPTSQLRFINSKIDAPVTYLHGLVLFDGTGAILGNTQNVNNPGGVTRLGLGRYQVSFSVALPTVNYLVLAEVGVSGSLTLLSDYSNKTVNNFRITVFNRAGTLTDPDEVSVMVFGLF